MISNTWKSKLQLHQLKHSDKHITVGNTFGLCFTQSNDEIKLIFIPLNESLQLKHQEYQSGTILCFDRELIEEDDVEYALDIFKLFNLSKDKTLHLDTVFWKEIQVLLNIIDKEHKRPDGAYLIIKSALKILLLQLIRYKKLNFLEQDLHQNRIFIFLNDMEKNYKQHFDTHFYANRLGISTKRLNQITKEKLNHTAHQIIQQRRLTEIKRELQNSNHTLKELAYTYSFNSDVSFSRFFKKHTGMTPSSYRNNATHNNDSV